MPALSRVGDANQAGGVILRGSTTIMANHIPIGLHVSPISIHKGHVKAVTTTGSATVMADSCQMLRVTSGNSCGHYIVKGSPDLYIP